MTGAAPFGAELDVLRLDVPARRDALAALLGRCGLDVAWHSPGAALPGSYWGDAEAGLVASTLHVRPDTPLHSALHEAAHFLCMDDARRSQLDRDAGGDVAEENAVCCLQLLLADELPGVGRARLAADMDAWGYTFRLGSAARWFDEDADDARAWLRQRGWLDAAGTLVIRDVRG